MHSTHLQDLPGQSRIIHALVTAHGKHVENLLNCLLVSGSGERRQGTATMSCHRAGRDQHHVRLTHITALDNGTDAIADAGDLLRLKLHHQNGIPLHNLSGDDLFRSTEEAHQGVTSVPRTVPAQAREDVTPSSHQHYADP